MQYQRRNNIRLEVKCAPHVDMLGHWTRKLVDYLRYSLKEVARFVLLDRYETALFGEGFLVYIKAPYIKHSSISPSTETEPAQYAKSQSRTDSLNSLNQYVFSYLVSSLRKCFEHSVNIELM